MHIAVLFEFGTLNGGEHSMLACIDRLRERIRFTAIAPAKGPLASTLRERGIEHCVFDVRESGRRKPRERLLDELAEVAERVAPDVLHANSLSMSRWTGAARGRLAGMAVTGHLRDIVKLSGAVIRDLNANDRLVAVSRATRDFHVGRGLDAERTVVLHNGVDLERFRPRPGTGSLRAELGLDAMTPMALVVGQIGLRKGQDVLVEAMLRNLAATFHVVLVGERFSSKDESLAFDRGLDERLRTGGADPRLHRLGYRTDVPELMNEADLLVHPAHQEPLGRVLLEAAASGLPIVATNVGGTPEILDEETALLVPPAEPAELAAAIARALEDPAATASRAAAARRTVEGRFDSVSAADELAEFWIRSSRSAMREQ